MESIEAMLWDFIVDNNIATEDEVRLVTDINGLSENTMTDIIYAKTGLRSYEQCTEEATPAQMSLTAIIVLTKKTMKMSSICLKKVRPYVSVPSIV